MAPQNITLALILFAPALTQQLLPLRLIHDYVLTRLFKSLYVLDYSIAFGQHLLNSLVLLTHAHPHKWLTYCVLTQSESVAFVLGADTH